MPDTSGRGARRRPTEIATRLERDIFSGLLAPGAKLPTEKQLAETFAASRTAVREAIAQLRRAQLLQTEQGRGTFVVPNPTRRPLFALSAQGIEYGELSEIFELRSEVEAGAAALAARHRTVRDMDAMRAALDRLQEAVRHGQAGNDADMAFHMCIASASRNRFFEEFMAFFADRVARSIAIARSNSARIKGRAQLVQHEHQSIFDAIADGEPEQARVAMRLHLQNANRRLGLDGRRPDNHEGNS